MATSFRTSWRKPVLAVQWDRTSIDYVLADRKAGRVRIIAAGSLKSGDEEQPPSPGEMLLAELQRLGTRRADLVVALGRGSVDVIPLHLPPAADDELPTLVSNQVMRDAGEIADTGIVDYVVLPGAADEPRTGFAFAVDATTIEQVKAEAAKASLKPCEIVYRPLASVTLLRRVVPQSQRTMILVTLHDREADISIVRSGGLIYTRTARLSDTKNVGDIAAQLAVEIRRSLAAASLTTDAEEQHLYVFGALKETEQLVQDLAEELSLPASLLDPLRAEQVEGPTPDRVGRLSPLLGMVYDHYGAIARGRFPASKRASGAAESRAAHRSLCRRRSRAGGDGRHIICGTRESRTRPKSRICEIISIRPRRDSLRSKRSRPWSTQCGSGRPTT